MTRAVHDEKDNVIHVQFGRDGGRVVRRGPERESADPAVPLDRGRRQDPLADLYSIGEVARLFGLTASRLRYWDTSGFLSPSGRHGRRRVYTFQDLIGIRMAKSLLEQGLPLQKVRKAVDSLRESLPKVTRPLAELKIVSDGGSILVQGDSAPFDATTGQLNLDFHVGSLRDDVVRVLRPEVVSEGHRRRAYELYLEGCRYDEDETTFDRAEEAYRKALEMDRTLANALTNLGNLRFRRGDAKEAERLYLEALRIDENQPEAYYNLGFLLFEGGQAEQARAHFEKALLHDPSFADAHFNLAMVLEELGHGAEARPHWETYLQLDPTGPWAEIARRHLSA